MVSATAAPHVEPLGVFTIIGQLSKQVTLVSHKSEAVSNPRAGKQAVAGCSGFQLLPQPATSLSHMGPRSRFENSLHYSSRVRITVVTALPEVHRGCWCISLLTAGRNHCFETGRKGQVSAIASDTPSW